MNVSRMRLPVLAAAVVALSTSAAARIELKPEGHFEAPGFAFLVYHNDYFMGKRGGLEAFLHGRRIIDAGEVIAVSRAGMVFGHAAKETGARVVDEGQKIAVVPEAVKELGLSWKLVCRTDGDSVILAVSLDSPVDRSRVASVALRFEIFTGEYAGKTYRSGETFGTFAGRYMGKARLVSGSREILVAPEDPLRAFTVSSEDAALELVDGRGMGEPTGFVVTAALPSGSDARTFSLRLTPRIDPSWRRDPVIQVSQVGYHPDQRKRAVLELDSRTTDVQAMELVAVDKDGATRTVRSGVPTRWGHLFDYEYYTFDFSDVREPGLYVLRYDRMTAGPFAVRADVFGEAWRPTLDVFLPVQMCHVEVRQGELVWHGACHLDDALQAPPNTVHFDSYRQKAETETRFRAEERVPGLDRGGWHDAGDYDLPAGSICQTVNWLALAREEFGASRDVTRVGAEERRVDLFRQDGKDDFLQQVAFGMESLLAPYRAAGHVCVGIIENKMDDYGVYGDPVNITDGLPYDPALRPDEKKNGRSGRHDDRWLFTNRNTGGQYQFAQTAAIASRVLRGFDDALADECLKAARDVWAYERAHPRVDFDVTYQPQEDEFHSWELAATAELFLTTGEEAYRRRLVELVPSIRAMSVRAFGGVAGFTLARAAGRTGDESFQTAVAAQAAELAKVTAKEFAGNPYGVPFEFYVWGNNWDVLDAAARLYYFIKHYPDTFPKEDLFSAVNYNFGCHPATNHSFVSGVGANSATVGYGFIASGATYIPGGVVSGPSYIRPKFIEFRSCEWDWYETEYVIGGAATYIFDVLAADALLNRKKSAS